jgi:GNAT superfamily N-acetyltransferase
MIVITPLKSSDRMRWEVLARGYKSFYETPTTDEEYQQAWQRLMADDVVHGLCASVDGQLVGIAHYLFHGSVWADTNCYLQDLFTDPKVRRSGVGSTLIREVAARARARGASRYYWLTKETNAPARAVYDRVAQHLGFIRYDFPLGQL